MDGSVERVPAQVKVLPSRPRRDGRGGRPFALGAEARPAESDEDPQEDPAVSAERPLGQAAPDEAGCRLDVSA